MMNEKEDWSDLISLSTFLSYLAEKMLLQETEEQKLLVIDEICSVAKRMFIGELSNGK